MDDARLARSARRNHGAFDQTFLDSIGIDARQSRRYVASGRWRRLHENVYAAASTPDTFDLRATAAVLALPNGVLSLRAAAVAHGCDLADPMIDLSVEHGRTNRLAGVRIHQACLPRHHVTRRRGWPVTTIERTLVDLGKVLPPTVLQRCIEDAVLTRRTTLARVESTFTELATKGRPGIARTRAVLAHLDPEPPTESELEAQFWRLLQRRRIRLPERQVSFDWLDRGADASTSGTPTTV